MKGLSKGRYDETFAGEDARMVADKFYKPVGAAPYLYACLVDL